MYMYYYSLMHDLNYEKHNFFSDLVTLGTRSQYIASKFWKLVAS